MVKDYIEMSINPDKDFDRYYRSRSRLTAQVRNIDEIISEKTIPVKSHHVGLMAILQAYHCLDQTNSRPTAYDRAGTATLIASGNGFEVETDTSSAVKGIVAGTGSTALDLTDFELTTKIAEGGSAGQFNYAATTISSLTSPSSDTWSFTMDRDMVNNSSGTITVEEVGFYVENGTSAYLAERTLVTQAVLDTQTFNAKYTEKVVV